MLVVAVVLMLVVFGAMGRGSSLLPLIPLIPRIHTSGSIPTCTALQLELTPQPPPSLHPQNAWHKGRLELIIRLMDCNDLEPSALDDIRDALDYYVESAADDDGTSTATPMLYLLLHLYHRHVHL